MQVWDPATLALQKELTGHSQAVWALLPLPSSKLLSGSGDRTIKLWDPRYIGNFTG